MSRRQTGGMIATALAAGALVSVAPAAAKGAGGFGTDGTAPGISTVTGPPGTDAAAIRYSAVRGNSSTSVSAIEADGGAIRDQRQLRGRWALPAVTVRGDPGGLAAEGETLVLLRPRLLASPRTTFRFLDARTLRTRDEVTFRGRWIFDAISPDGELVYLIEYPDPDNFVEYRVRAYDLAAGELRPRPIVDPDEAGEPMTGEPVSRVTSTGGRWAYTLYRGEETFVHALDTEEATAVCIDLPQLEQANYFALDLTVDPGTGAINVLERGDPAAVIDPETFELGSPSAPNAAPTPDRGTDWPVWALIAGGVVLCAGAFAVLRRRQRRAPAVEAGLKEALKDGDSGEREEARPREPVA